MKLEFANGKKQVATITQEYRNMSGYGDVTFHQGVIIMTL
jgi:hypothetical protein